ncbi:alpha/beta fold hydrolase [Cellulosimicrobium sp. NPDC057862]|uniref:alpha/beta fold hydrolase n=1 Tax=Cellulosimicrobium sp. NPDC057862 TaxID=3346266 RepID=UPI00366AC18F
MTAGTTATPTSAQPDVTAATHTYATLDVPVAGGRLRVGVWDPVPAPGARPDDGARGGEHARPDHARPDATPDTATVPTVLAVHGITASHRAWPAVVAALPGVRVVAPDLRGRGRSNTLPGPFGMGAHADDLATVLDALGIDRVVALGHSMGAFVSVVLAHRHPGRVSRLVLVDGGIPLPPPVGLPPDADHDQVLRALLGPAVERLERTFADREEYRGFWRAHPAFASAWDEPWGDVVAGYVDYDLVGEAPALRPASSGAAVSADSLELYEGGPLADALAGDHPLDVPLVLLRAPRGLLDEPEALYSPGHLAAWRARLPGLRTRDVAGINHYTIIMSPPGVEAVAGETLQALAAVTSGGPGPASDEEVTA